MSQPGLPDDYSERIATLRGRRHGFPTLDPARTALVVLDMRNAFVAAVAARRAG